VKTFDDMYKNEELYYGLAPSPYLEMLIKREKFHHNEHALDVGCGDGRNSIFLAENGFQVTAIDNSKEAILKLQNFSKERRLNIKAVVADVTKYKFKKDKFSLIVANTIIDHLEKEDGDRLIVNLKSALMQGGLIFVSVFTVEDPGNKNLPIRSETAAYIKRYFLPGELRSKFSDLTLLRYHEEELLDCNHGEPHYHFMARIISKKL